MTEEEKLERVKAINAEIKRLKGLFKDVSPLKKKTIEGLIEEIAFMRITIRGLKETINDSGPIDEMPQGDYSILREHPAVRTYNTMIQRYTTASKELFALLPKEVEKE